MTAEPPNPALAPPGTPGSRASCAKSTFPHQQHHYCNRNNAVYNRINPTSFCAGSSYVMLMLTRCATLRDSPGNQRPSKRLVFYIALRLQPVLINPRAEAPAISNPVAAGHWCPLQLPAARQNARLSLACSGCPLHTLPLVPTFGHSSGLFIARCWLRLGGMPGCRGKRGIVSQRRCDHTLRLT